MPIPSVRLRAFWLLPAMVATLPAQQASGTVRGLAGEVAAGAIVRALDAERQNIAETMTDELGAFALRVKAPIARLLVRIEGVVVELPVTGGAATGLTVSFAGAPHVVIHGQVIDPGGTPARARDLSCRDGQQHTIVTLTTDAEGKFTLRTNQDVRDVVLDPLGWRHVVPGPFAAERDLAIDLRQHRERFFRLRGQVRDEQGRPASGYRLVATGPTGRVAATTSGGDGAFALWCNQAVHTIEASSGPPRMGRLGSWQSDAEIDLDEHDHALVLVSGRFLDKDGAGIPGALVIPSLVENPPNRGTPALGGTDAAGRFFVQVVRGTPFLFVVNEKKNAMALAAIPGDGRPLELRAR